MTEVNDMLEQVPESSKPIYTSRTFWTGIFGALIPLVPGLSDWVMANPQLYAALLSGIFIGLRTITKGKVTIK